MDCSDSLLSFLKAACSAENLDYVAFIYAQLRDSVD